jgi:DNA-binding FrmR family transcriptional regulator
MTAAHITPSQQPAGRRRYARLSQNDHAAACGCELHSRPRKAAGVCPEIKSANLKRLKRIEGQVRGLARMVEQDRYCPDIMVQISSVQEALRAVGRGLMRNHLRHCASRAIRNGNPAKAEATYDELMKLIYTHAR